MNKYSLFFILLFPLSSVSGDIIIQSTTSTRDSGLYEYLLPNYPDYKNVTIKTIAVGTGQAIANAYNCDADLLIVHDNDKEMKFMNSGYGKERVNLMYNDFVVVGPINDPANIANKNNIYDIFLSIYESKSFFVSRSDSSGTHMAEMSIWSEIKVDPHPGSALWYFETGQGMGPSLNVAVSLGAYILTDRSSWIKFSNKGLHKILYRNPVELKNQYGMILISPDKCPNMNYKESLQLFRWLSSSNAKNLINSYKIDKTQVFFIK